MASLPSEDDVLGHLETCTENAGREESESFVPLVNLRHINQNLMLTYIPHGPARETKDFCNLE